MLAVELLQQSNDPGGEEDVDVMQVIRILVNLLVLYFDCTRL